MASLPKATTQVNDTAGALAGGLDTVCLVCPVATNADVTPRQYGAAAAVYAQHGFAEGVEYSALHAQLTRKPFIFVGIPIVTPGVVGRENTSGNTGTSATTVVAGGSGVLGEHDGIARVTKGGTVGTDQIGLEISMDGGRTFKKVRLGIASSYAIPFFNVTINFAAGTLVTGDTIHTWHGTAPKGDSSGWQAAREALAAQQKGFRSMLLFGDLSTDTEASAFNTQLEAYETANERFIFGRASLRDRLPQARLSATSSGVTGAPSLTFDATADTVERSAGSWLADGFAVGDTVTVDGTVSNDGDYLVVAVTATLLDLGDGLVDEVIAVAPGVSVTAQPTLTFVDVGETITRNRGSWLADGFRVGDVVTITGTDGALNDGTFTVVTPLTELVMKLEAGSVDAAESIGVGEVTVSAGETKAAWMAALDAEFAPVDDAFRIDLSAGRGRVLSPFSGWFMRRPAAWAASLREYQHDLHVATWKKDDGPVGFDLFDADGVLVEWDDRVDGEAGSAARFTTLRTWANGPQGAFITQSLTRGLEGSLLSQTHNVAVVNLACTVVQLNTENVIGRSLVLNDDGIATSDSLKTIESEVNAALELALLQNRGEGPRASKAVWTASTDDILNVPEALLTGVLDLNLNGTIHSVNTQVRVRSGGQ